MNLNEDGDVTWVRSELAGDCLVYKYRVGRVETHSHGLVRGTGLPSVGRRLEGHCGERGKQNLNRGTNRDHLGLPQGEKLSELCAIAEEVLEELCCGDGSSQDYMQFHRRPEKQGITVEEIQQMSIGTIQREYLAEILPEARSMVRQRVDSTAPDNVLDEIFALLWQGKLIWWSTAAEYIRTQKEERGEEV